MGAMPGGFWQRVLASDMAVPSDRPLPELTAELVTMLGSSDPVERDELAFTVLAAWINEGVYDDLLVSFGDSICNGLRVGVGDVDSDAVFRRSFSALTLAVCIDRDNRAHLLPVDVVIKWAERFIGWFTREQDMRGWVPDKGWAHTVAHGADLLGALARSRHLGADHLGVLLDVVAERLLSDTPYVLVDGEDDRLAYAVLTVLQRNLLDTATLDSWVDSLASAAEPRPGGQAGPTAAPVRNTSNFLRALYAHLSIGIAPADSPLSFVGRPTCRPDLMLALLKAIPRFTPWLY
jgi:hypothetical protein